MKLKTIIIDGLKYMRQWLSEDILEHQKEQDTILLGLFEHQKKQDDLINQLIDNNKDIYYHLKETRADVLRLKITSQTMPLKERVIAGEIYTNELHLNGDIKATYEVLVEEYKEELRKKENGGQ